MYQDPYKVLGVSETASDDEIKKAYRELAKKYHPDRNPGNDAAAQKMNEINAAYDAIKNGTAKQQNAYGGYNPYGSGQGQGYNPYGGYSNGYTYSGNGGAWDFYSWADQYARSQYQQQQQQERTEYIAAKNYIRSGHYKEALTCLAGVPENERDGRWYYMTAVANMYLGNKVSALENARMAVSMDPGNEEYHQLVQRLEGSGSYYDNYTTTYRSSFSPDKLLCAMCAANALCGPMCGFRFFCC